MADIPFHLDVLWYGLDCYFVMDPVNHVLMSRTEDRSLKFLHAIIFVLKIVPFF